MAGSQPIPVDEIADNEEELEKKIKEIVCHFMWMLGYPLTVS
jgi:hypothetical protein